MKINILLLFGIFFMMTQCTSTMEQQDKKLRHIVLFKFKQDTKKEDIKAIETSFNSLPSKINEIKDFEWGINNSPEGLNKGFTHCFFLTFSSELDRETYLPHPAHKDFIELISPHIEDVCVVDYWTK